MGSDASKGHEAFTVTPAAPARMSDAVELRDDRPAGSAPLQIDARALDAALGATGVAVGPQTIIKVRLRPQTSPGQQGSARRLGTDAYRVVIHVAGKAKFEDRHLYVINNSLLHELRHVSQMQKDPDHELAYASETLMAGYANNKYEVEARHYGRLADPAAGKDTGSAGPPLGKTVWALRPG